MVSLYVQVQGLVDAVEGVLFATAAAAGSATAAAAPSAQVEEARDRCLSQLEAVRVATHALPSALPAPPVGGDDAAAQDPALETLRAERDQLRAEVQRKNRDLKATLDAMRSLQADLVMIQTQRQETLDTGGSSKTEQLLYCSCNATAGCRGVPNLAMNSTACSLPSR